MKILADRNLAGVETLFAGVGDIELFTGRELGSVAGADILLTRSVTRVNAALLGDASLRFVGTATSGFDHVDRKLLAARGIPFAHAPGSNADSVVDYVLSALSHAGDSLERLLTGTPYGIIGYGHIGRRLHHRLARLGIACVAYDPWLSAADHPVLTELSTVLSCPVVSVHAALTGDQPWPSFHMLDADRLGALPEGAVLINAGRGELIAGPELLALKARRPDLELVLDVWEGEPVVDPALLAQARFGTAHIAGYSYDGKLRATEMLFRAACAAMPTLATAGEPAALLEAVPVTPPPLEGAPLLRWLLAQVYDVRDDDQLLRQAMPTGFDRLRKTYRRRRELGSLRVVNTAGLTPAALALCEALELEMTPC